MESPSRKSHKDLDVVFNFMFLIEIVIHIVPHFFTGRKSRKKFRSLLELTKHFKIRSVRQPCNICNMVIFRRQNQKTSYYTSDGKVRALYRINSHDPRIIFSLT